MASNYTEHYELPIWDAGDSFLRTEFNEAHQKIDAALAEKADSADVEAVRTLAQGRALLTFGSYNGDGQASQTVLLGFQPKLVLVVSGGGLNAQRIHECGAQMAYPGRSSHMLSVTSDGFTVSGEGSLGLNSSQSSYNPCFYLAVR